MGRMFDHHLTIKAMDSQLYNAQGVQVNNVKTLPDPLQSHPPPPPLPQEHAKLTRRLSKLHLSHDHSDQQKQSQDPAPPPPPQKPSKLWFSKARSPHEPTQQPQMTFQQFCSKMLPEHPPLPHPSSTNLSSSQHTLPSVTEHTTDFQQPPPPPPPPLPHPSSTNLSSSQHTPILPSQEHTTDFQRPPPPPPPPLPLQKEYKKFSRRFSKTKSPQQTSSPQLHSSTEQSPPHQLSSSAPQFFSPQVPQPALQKPNIFNRRLSKLRTSSTSSPQFPASQLPYPKSPEHLTDQFFSSSPQLTPPKISKKEAKKEEKESKRIEKEAKKEEKETKKKEWQAAKQVSQPNLFQQTQQQVPKLSLAKSLELSRSDSLCSNDSPIFVNESFYSKIPSLISQPPACHNIHDANRSYSFICIGDYCTFSDASGNVVYNYCTDPQLGCIKLTDAAGQKLAAASTKAMKLCVTVVTDKAFRSATYSRANVTGAKRLEEEGPSGYAYDLVTKGNCWLWNTAKGGKPAMTFLNDKVYFYPTCSAIAEKAIALVHAYESSVKAKEEKAKDKAKEQKEEKKTSKK